MRNKTRKPALRGKPAPHPVIRAITHIGLPALGLGFAMWGVAVVGNLAAIEKPADASASAGIVVPVAAKNAAAPAPVPPAASRKSARLAQSEKMPRAVAAKPVATAIAETRKHGWSQIFTTEPDVAFASDAVRAARFASVAAKHPVRLARVFGVAEPVVARMEPAKAVVPAAARFGNRPTAEVAASSTILAFADPSPTDVNGALAALSAVSPSGNGVPSPDDEANDADGTALFPDYEDTPENTPLPIIRPRLNNAETPNAEQDEPRETARTKAEKPQRLAYAKPDNPTGERGVGNSLKNLFSRPKVSQGVAVYDISAAKVYMPDGSVLEAHSGIGKMADNPKYAHVKMSGPTPPHTYNLRMREKRFHGVEAIRMLPVDGKNKHGRDGFLTHSYLLRGGRAESHGCVAFKDYNKFLNAFKQGKVKQLVVVPGGGSAIARNVRKGHDA